MFALEIVFIGSIGIFGFFWQKNLLEKDLNNKSYPLRYLAPIFLGFIFILGLLIHGFIAILIDERSNYDLIDLTYNLWKSFILFLSFQLKSIFGALFTTLTVCVGFYYLFEYSEFKIWSFLQAFFKWAFIKMPQGFEIMYKLLLFFVAILWTTFDSFSPTK